VLTVSGLALLPQNLIRNTKLNIMTKVSNEEQSNSANVLLGVVYCVIDTSNYYSEPVTIRIFNTEQKAIDFCKSKPFEKYYWEEVEVE
jgi:hypothetical protein